MIGFTSKGSTKRTEAWLQRTKDAKIYAGLARFGDEGVRALSAATPRDSGATATSWTYEIIQDATSWSIVWGNTNIHEGRPIAVLLQYGHGTGTGGYVSGRDYINPSLKPIFDRMAEEAWKVVTSA